MYCTSLTHTQCDNIPIIVIFIHSFLSHTHIICLALYETFRKTLKEYETTLEKQSLYIHKVEEEKESLHSHSDELELKVTEMERQLAKASSSRDGLTTRIQELTQTLEGELGLALNFHILGGKLRGVCV